MVVNMITSQCIYEYHGYSLLLIGRFNGFIWELWQCKCRG